QALRRFPDLSRTAILYGGADGDMFHPPQSRDHEGPPGVLFASRLVPEKGAHVLLEAMRLLERRGIDLTLKVFGASAFGGSAATKYTRDLEHNVPPNVHFCGYKSGHELAQEYRAADIFCLPSTYEEPLGMVLVEAIACGLPVVSSRIGGIPEVISDEVGILVPPSDPEELASALARYAASKDLRSRTGEAGISLFRKKFTWDCVREEYLKLLDTVVTS
ncbi:MAG: glycosyltransferase family 4 protein, partial [Alloacidobacterium sp.]